MGWNLVIQALVVASVTALVGGYINSLIMHAHLKDMKERIVRIENYLNGLLKDKHE